MVEICNVGSVDNSFAPISMNLASGDVVMIRCQDRHKRVLFDIFSGYEKDVQVKYYMGAIIGWIFLMIKEVF